MSYVPVILSAGSIGTPQLLLLSGIGSKQDLQSAGIQTLVDLPDVGKNLQDQPIFFFQSTVNKATAVSTVLTNQTLFAQALTQYEENKTGLLASSPVINQSVSSVYRTRLRFCRNLESLLQGHTHLTLFIPSWSVFLSFCIFR